ncbi:MAG: acyltransferase family protein [Chloroflexota bacterium]
MDNQPGFQLGYVPALDGLRALAVLSVALLHFRVPFVPGGYFGVDLFFVLSGFLITGMLLAEWQATGRISLPQFYGRRALRLVPALLLFLLVVSRVVDWKLVLAALFYVFNWIAAQGQHNGPVLHLWSLSVEGQFYLLWPPLLILLLRRQTLPRIILAMILTTVAAVAVYRYYLCSLTVVWPYLMYRSDMRADALLVGCALAVTLHWYETAARRVVTAFFWFGPAAFLGLLGLVLTVPFDSLSYQGGYSLAALLAAVLIASAVLCPKSPLARILSWQPLVRLGGISYGVYIWHFLVVALLIPWGLPWYVGFPLGMSSSLAVAVLSWRCIERPALALKGRLRSQPLCTVKA